MAKPFSQVAVRALRTAGGKSESRTKMIAAVRAACRRLGIDDDDRRNIQQEVVGKPSLGEMDLAELGRLLDHLNKGWKGTPQSARYQPHRAHTGKIRALWWTLYWLGAIVDPGDAPLDAFVKRQAGVSALRFLDHRRAASVIEALKAWAAREGVAWPDTARLSEQPTADRHAVLAAIAVKLRDAGGLAASHLDYCEKALALGCNHWTWTPHELDAAIKLLGKRLRRVARSGTSGEGKG